MYLRTLKLQNFKLLRDVEIDFTTKDGKPRPFTVILGENGMCKTSLLQAIAIAASGSARANQVAEAASYLDLRQAEPQATISATFSFSQTHHPERIYPGLEDEQSRRKIAPQLRTYTTIQKGFDLFLSTSAYHDERGDPIVTSDASEAAAQRTRPPGQAKAINAERFMDPLRDARGRNLGHWFVAAYGVGRTLPAPMSVGAEEIASPSRDRIWSLFNAGRRIIGTGFADLLPPRKTEAFQAHLREAFVEHEILPHARTLSLQARGNINNALERIKAHRLTLDLPSGAIDIPTLWLSHGYQSTMAWVSDLVGQVWWEADKQKIPLAEMEGICLIDEIDLHLHPLWQTNLVRSLKTAFPKIQFIATTHSPMVLPGLAKDEIVRLRQDDEGNVTTELPKIVPALKTGTELYSDFFDIDRLEPRKLDDALVRYGGLASYAGRSDAEDKEVHELLAFLRENEIEPGWEPVPRERPKRPRAVKPRKKAATR